MFRIIAKIMGACDLVCGFIILIVSFSLISLPHRSLFLAALYLVGKGVIFGVISKDIASLLDIASGLYALILLIGLSSHLIAILIFLYLAQKFILSFF